MDTFIILIVVYMSKLSICTCEAYIAYYIAVTPQSKQDTEYGDSKDHSDLQLGFHEACFPEGKPGSMMEEVGRICVLHNMGKY